MHERYRADMDAMAAQLKRAAAIGGVMRGSVKRRHRHLYACFQHTVRFESASRKLGVRGELNRQEFDFLRASLVQPGPGHRRRVVVQANDGVYLGNFREDLVNVIESSHWLNKRAFEISMCGRSAVGVGLMRKAASDLPGEKVYHANCKGRLCHACNARRAANFAPGLKALMLQEFGDSQRLFFATLTVRHKFSDSLDSTKRVLDLAWGRLIKTVWFKDTFDERLRCAEVENTYDNGWHPHFHLLLRMREGCKAQAWPRIEVENELKRLWRRCTERVGRASWQVDLRELEAEYNDAGNVVNVCYWLRPEERRRLEILEHQGKVKLKRKRMKTGESVLRVMAVNDMVDELTKYVTKRHANGMKPNQKPLDKWTDEEVREYALGIRNWNLRRASKGWEQDLIELNEKELLAREIEADNQGGYEYFPWAQIIDECRQAAAHKLSPEKAEQFASDYPRILNALDRAGCDVSVDQIKGYVFRFFGDVDAPLGKLSVQPHERAEWAEEQTARALADAEVQKQLRARHWRVLLKLRRLHDRGRERGRPTGLGMSRKRLEDCLGELQQHGLVEAYEPNAEDPPWPPGMTYTQYRQRCRRSQRSLPTFALTDVGRRLIPTRIPDPRKKHAARKALRDAQRALPGMLWMEDD